jgi:hypothetical protein
MVRHHRHTGTRNAAARMIAARRVHRSHREVERADSGHYSYKTAHVGLIFSVRLQLM